MTTASVVRGDLEREARMAQTLLDDLHRRLRDNSPPSLIHVAARALVGSAIRALDLAAEYRGLTDEESTP